MFGVARRDAVRWMGGSCDLILVRQPQTSLALGLSWPRLSVVVGCRSLGAKYSGRFQTSRFGTSGWIERGIFDEMMKGVIISMMEMSDSSKE